MHPDLKRGETVQDGKETYPSSHARRSQDGRVPDFSRRNQAFLLAPRSNSRCSRSQHATWDWHPGACKQKSGILLAQAKTVLTSLGGSKLAGQGASRLTTCRVRRQVVRQPGTFLCGRGITPSYSGKNIALHHRTRL